MKGLVELMYPALAPYASQTREIVGTLAKTMEVHISSPELKLLVTITQVVEESGRVRGFLKILPEPDTISIFISSLFLVVSCQLSVIS